MSNPRTFSYDVQDIIKQNLKEGCGDKFIRIIKFLQDPVTYLELCSRKHAEDLTEENLFELIHAFKTTL